MTPTSVLVYSLLFVFSAVVLLALAAGLVLYLRARIAAWRELTKALQACVEAFEGNREHLKAIPGLVAGLIEVSRTQVEQLVAVKAVVEMLRGCLFSGEKGSGYQEYSDTESGRENEVQLLMREHDLDRNEAVERVREKDLYSKLGRGK